MTILDYAKAMNNDNSITNEMLNLELLPNNQLIYTHKNPKNL